jgi:hypothetical protein
MLRNPFAFLSQTWKDKNYYKLWIEDLKYYQACSLFNGRMPPDYARLVRLDRKCDKKYLGIKEEKHANSNF